MPESRSVGLAMSRPKKPAMAPAPRQGQHPWQPQLHGQLGRGVGAEGVEGGMPDGQKPHVAVEQVEAERQDGVDADEHHHLDVVHVGDKRRHHRKDRNDQEDRGVGQYGSMKAHHS